MQLLLRYTGAYSRSVTLQSRALIVRNMASSASSSGVKLTPDAQQTVREIREGSAHLKFGTDVFYNNVQVVNRDFSILALNVFLEQHQKEIELRTKWKEEGLSGWRRAVLTWNEWGNNIAPAINKEKNQQHSSKKVKIDNEDGGGDIVPAKKSASCSTQSFVTKQGDDGNFRILEALSASGLRSIRYGMEIAPSVKKVIMVNDREEAAVESIRKHTEENGPYPSGTVLLPSHADAIDLMHSRRTLTSEKFHVVDLDPYGAPTEFLDSAVQCVESGGLLCVTATDTAVLCGSNMEKCRPKYGGVALHRPYSHEMGIRLLLAAIESAAIKHQRFIVPLLSLKLDFYIRVFVRVYSDRVEEVNRSATRHAYVLQSKQTSTFRILPLMKEDGNKPVPYTYDQDWFSENVQAGAFGGWMMGGPIWSAPIHNFEFVNACLVKLKTYKKDSPFMQLKWADRLEGILAAVKEELPDVPLYYDHSVISKTFHCTAMSLQKFQAALMNAGYRVSQSHHTPLAVKTDAPSEVIWDIYRCWVLKHPVSERRLAEDATAAKLLSVPPVLQANFDPPRSLREALALRKNAGKFDKSKKDAQDKQDKPAAPKWHPNPERNWGPKTRAYGSHPNKRNKQDDEQPK